MLNVFSGGREGATRGREEAKPPVRPQQGTWVEAKHPPARAARAVEPPGQDPAIAQGRLGGHRTNSPNGAIYPEGTEKIGRL